MLFKSVVMYTLQNASHRVVIQIGCISENKILYYVMNVMCVSKIQQSWNRSVPEYWNRAQYTSPRAVSDFNLIDLPHLQASIYYVVTSLPSPPKVKEVMFSPLSVYLFVCLSVFGCLSVCLFVCVQDISKSCVWVRMKLCGEVPCIRRTK